MVVWHTHEILACTTPTSLMKLVEKDSALPAENSKEAGKRRVSGGEIRICMHRTDIEEIVVPSKKGPRSGPGPGSSIAMP